MTRASLTPLQRFALLSRWRAKLAEDGKPHDIEHIPSGWVDYLEPAAEHADALAAANDEHALPMDVRPPSRASLAIFFAVPALLALVAAAALVLDRCTA